MSTDGATDSEELALEEGEGSVNIVEELLDANMEDVEDITTPVLEEITEGSSTDNVTGGSEDETTPIDELTRREDTLVALPSDELVLVVELEDCAVAEKGTLYRFEGLPYDNPTLLTDAVGIVDDVYEREEIMEARDSDDIIEAIVAEERVELDVISGITENTNVLELISTISKEVVVVELVVLVVLLILGVVVLVELVVAVVLL